MNASSLQAAQSIARSVLEQVNADKLDLSTPCSAWNVGQLADHIVGAQHWAASAMKGEAMTETGEGASQGDLLAAFDAAASNTLDAFNADGALDKMVDPGFGPMPANALLGMATMDTFAHAWDLATALGQNTNFDPELAAQLLESAKASIPDSFRGEEGAPFGPQQEAPEGASAADQLAAFLGRKI